MSKTASVRVQDLRAPLSEVALWFIFCTVNGSWALHSAAMSKAAGMDLFVILRAGLAALAATVLAWRLSGGAIAPGLASIWLIVLSALHVIESLSSGFTAFDSDLAGVMFLMAALVYRGPARLWWRGLVPVAALILFAPVAVLENQGEISSHALMRISLLPILSLVAGALLAVLRDTRTDSFAAVGELVSLKDKSKSMVTEMKLMEKEMRVLMSMMKTPQQMTSNSDNAWAQILRDSHFVPTVFEADPLIHGPSPYEQEPSRVLSHRDIQAILQSAIDDAKSRTNAARIRFEIASVESTTLPLALRADRDEFRAVVRSLLAHAVSALGGGSGVVRVALRSTLSTLVITFEDNGNGLSEDILAKRRIVLMDAAGEDAAVAVSLAQVRKLAQSWGGSLDYHARLGVGARAQLDLLRVDNFAVVANPGASLLASLTARQASDTLRYAGQSQQDRQQYQN